MKKRSVFGWLALLLGLGMLLLGVFILLCPQRMGGWPAAVCGALTMAAGVLDTVLAIKAGRCTGLSHLPVLLAGSLGVMAGAVLLAHPGVGAVRVLFPLWAVVHSLARLAQLRTVRLRAGRRHGYISLGLNGLGLLAGVLLLLPPAVRLVGVGAPVGVCLAASGAETVILACSRVGVDW